MDKKGLDTKVATLLTRMASCLHGRGGAVILDSSFRIVPSIVALAIKGLYSIACTKKYAYWLKYLSMEETLYEMEGKEGGTERVWKGMYKVGHTKYICCNGRHISHSYDAV